MPLSFSTALSGLRASSNSIDVSGNNIANSNTVGFKSSSVNFADVYADASSARQIGDGVQTTDTPTNFQQGTLADTGTSTNVALQGQGFFVVGDSAANIAYTRAGDFTIDKNGFLVNPSGAKVQGYNAVNGTVPPDALIGTVQVPVGEMLPPVMTTETTFRMNLNSADVAGTEFHAPVRVFDSKGTARSLDLVFAKQVDGSYNLEATLDGTAAQVNGAATIPVTFDAAGQLTAPTSLVITPDQTTLDGASLPSINVNLRRTNPDGTPGNPNITSYAAQSTVDSSEQDGFAAGTHAGLTYSEDGTGVLYSVFSNGQTRALAQLAVATFASQNGLRRLGGNGYGETIESGQASIGKAGTGGRGNITGSAIEQSNVDLATEFTDLIVAQRSYQANSRVITTINQTLQDLLQII
ncbi:MAG: flagellar hook protein FlgE [Pyrinomonadaceae bacterium]